MDLSKIDLSKNVNMISFAKFVSFLIGVAVVCYFFDTFFKRNPVPENSAEVIPTTIPKKPQPSIISEEDSKKLDQIKDKLSKKSNTNNGTDIFGKYPETSQKKLYEQDLRRLTKLDKWELKIMRNEILARKGYQFIGTHEVSAYFNNQEWYKNISKISEDVPFICQNLLSDIEKHNVELIKECENK